MLHLNQWEKVKSAYWWLSQDSNFLNLCFYLILFFLPTQLGKHFWPDFSFINGIRLDYLSPTFYLTDLLIIAFIFTGAIKKKININIFFILSLLMLLATSFFAFNKAASFYVLLKFLEFSLFAFIVASSFPLKENLVKILSVVLIIQSIIVIFQFIKGGSLNGFFYFLGERFYNGSTPGVANASVGGELILRPYGTFSHPNVLAGFLLLIMTMVIFYPLKNKYLYYLSFFLGSISLSLTLSRAAIVLWIITILFLLIKKRSYFLPAALGIISLCIFSFSLYPRFIPDAFAVSSRLSQVLLGASLFLKNPFFGIGLNNFFFYVNEMKFSKTLFLQPIHNIFFLVLVEAGLFSLILMITIFFKALKITFLKNKILFILLLQIIFLGFVDHYFLTLQQGQLLFALIFGFSFAFKNSARI